MLRHIARYLQTHFLQQAVDRIRKDDALTFTADTIACKACSTCAGKAPDAVCAAGIEVAVVGIHCTFVNVCAAKARQHMQKQYVHSHTLTQ